jgi:broad specificity phosphatase PhoE
MASIYLIRHGQASFGTTDYDRLSDLGAGQAQLAGDYLNCAGGPIKRIVCGTLLRQRQTAAIVASCVGSPGGMPVGVEIDERLDEIELERKIPLILPLLDDPNGHVAALAQDAGVSSRSFQKLVKHVFLYWQALEQPLHGMQSWRDFSERVRALIAEIMMRSSSGDNTVLVTSGGIVACATQQALDLPKDAVYGLFEVIRNCSLTHLLHDRERLSLASFNESAYLCGGASGFHRSHMLTYR